MTAAPSDGADPSRLRQDCSHPLRHLPGRTVLSDGDPCDGDGPPRCRSHFHSGQGHPALPRMSSDGQDLGMRAAATGATAVRIVETASRLLGEQLFDQVTLPAVAQGAGVTAQTVIRRFGSKEELFSAVARRRSVALRSARDEATVGDPTGAIALLVAGYERCGPEILHLLAQEHRTPVISELLDEARRFHRDWVARVFAPQFARIIMGRRQHELAKLVAVTDLYTWRLIQASEYKCRATTAEIVSRNVDNGRR